MGRPFTVNKLCLPCLRFGFSLREIQDEESGTEEGKNGEEVMEWKEGELE
jgi:hypothetical protein